MKTRYAGITMNYMWMNKQIPTDLGLSGFVCLCPTLGKMQFTVRGLFLGGFGGGLCDGRGGLCVRLRLGHGIGLGLFFGLRLGLCRAVQAALGRYGNGNAADKVQRQKRNQKNRDNLAQINHAFCLQMPRQAATALPQNLHSQGSCIRSFGQEQARWWGLRL